MLPLASPLIPWFLRCCKVPFCKGSRLGCQSPVSTFFVFPTFQIRLAPCADVGEDCPASLLGPGLRRA